LKIGTKSKIEKTTKIVLLLHLIDRLKYSTRS